MNLYRNVDRTKVQFDFLTCKEGVFDEEIRELGGVVHRIPYISDIGHFKYIDELDLFFENHPQYRVVHSHMDRMSGFVLRAARKAGVPVRIAHSHSTRSEGSIAAKMYKWYAGMHIHTSATHYLACTHAAAKWLFSRKAGTARILNNGIDCAKFAYSPFIRKQVREELGIEDDVLVIGHIGRMDHVKNHSGLLDIFAKLQPMHNNSLLLLVGDGKLRTAVEGKASKLMLSDRIKLLGIRGDVERLVQAMDVFVFPSYYEGLPVTLIEAQGSGLPCVISSGVAAEVDAGAGLTQFAPINDISLFARLIVEAASKPRSGIDPSAMARNGYDIKQSAQAVTELYLGYGEVKHENVDRIYAHV